MTSTAARASGDRRPPAGREDAAALAFRDDLLRGLSQTPKRTPPKHLYDERGSALFDEITRLPEYYPTRTETRILRERGAEIAAAIGPRALVIEPGAGSGIKTRLLLGALDRPAAIAPIDISPAYVRRSAERLRAAFPDVEVLPACGDFTRPLEIPRPAGDVARRVIFFPGSTLGNFDPPEAEELLQTFADDAGEDGGLLVGLDLVKSPEVLVPAYDDARGVTAAFNLNLLERANRELGADFDLAGFRHEARWNAELERIEMHLVSRREQEASVAGRTFRFAERESIHTESSHKFRRERFEATAGRCGLELRGWWTDERGWFAVAWLEPA